MGFPRQEYRSGVIRQKYVSIHLAGAKLDRGYKGAEPTDSWASGTLSPILINIPSKSTFLEEDSTEVTKSEHESRSVVSNSLWPYGLYSSWNSLGQNFLEWVAFPFSRGSSQPRDRTRSPTLQVESLPAEPQGKPKHTGVGSLSLLQQIFLTQESNQDLLHCRQILYPLRYQESPATEVTKAMADACWCMAKPIQYCKVKKNNNNKIKKKFFKLFSKKKFPMEKWLWTILQITLQSWKFTVHVCIL